MPNTTHIDLPFGKAHLGFDLPTANLLGSFAPHHAATVADVPAEIARALAHPIGAPRLEELARGAKRVVIVADDNTRPTPAQVIIPPLLAALNAAGVPDAHIEIIIALGTHRPMNPAEIALKFGAEVVCRVAVLNHEAFDPTALVDLGVTPGGVSVQVNRRVMEADLVLGIGSIVPHHIPGYSGGAKIIQPGVCGERTTGAVHLLSVRRERSLLGEVENQVREEMEAIATQAGLRAILNTVTDNEGGVVGAVYGDPRAAFRAGVALSRQVYGVRVPRQADIVVASSYPCDIEFWQAHKTLYPAERCVRAGGTIIIATPCPEGVAVTHPEMLGFAGWPGDKIDAALRDGSITDTTAGALALAWANARRHARVAIVSEGITPAEARALSFHPFASIPAALEDAFARHGRAATVSILPSAPDTLPLLDA
jgi:nickel-dependent lactate racemase